MGLIVRDECERSVKNQASKGKQVDFTTSLRVAHEKQPAKKPTCRARDWKMKSHDRLSFSQLSRWKG